MRSLSRSWSNLYLGKQGVRWRQRLRIYEMMVGARWHMLVGVVLLVLLLYDSGIDAVFLPMLVLVAFLLGLVLVVVSLLVLVVVLLLRWWRC